MNDKYDVYLRPLREEDAKTSWRWRNDSRVWEKTGSRPNCHVTEEMELDWMRKVLADKTSRRYAIVLKDSDRYIGNIYLTDIQNGQAEQETFIGEPDLWGKGIGTHARTLPMQIAKDDLGLKAIKSVIRLGNIASIKANLKIGFREVGRDGEFVYLEKPL